MRFLRDLGIWRTSGRLSERNILRIASTVGQLCRSGRGPMRYCRQDQRDQNLGKRRYAESLCRPRQQIALLSQVPSRSFRGCSARRLVEFTPVAPMGRLDIDVPLTSSVDPIGPVLVTRKWERMDDTIIVQHADLEISVRRRHRSGLPFGGEGMHDVPP